MTPAAISHQVKALEDELRFKLFDRQYRGVQLTETGAYLFVAIQRSFEAMGEAVDQLRSRSTQASVSIQSTSAISSLWLTPRLGQFWRSHGHISVGQILSDDGIDRQTADLSIRYGDINSETGTCEVLFQDNISALGSPEFAEKFGSEEISGVGKMPLIHLDTQNSQWTTWEEWARSLDYRGGLRTAHRVNNYVIALQAALDGIGALLGWDGLTGDHVATGRLVKVLPFTVPSPLDLYVKLHNGESTEARILFDWLANHSTQGRSTKSKSP